jgi:hypothetical protein
MAEEQTSQDAPETITSEAPETPEPENSQAAIESPAAKGKPDAAKASEAYKQQRDEARAKHEALEKRIAELEVKDQTVKDLQTQLETEKAERAKEAKNLEAKRVNTLRLTQAGCIDPDVALGLLNEHGDVEKLKEEKPYLFGAEKPKGSTGLKPDGTSTDDAERERVRKLLGRNKNKE